MLAAATPYVLPGYSFVLYARLGSPLLSYTAIHKEIAELLTSARTV